MRILLNISILLLALSGYAQRNYLYGEVTESATLEPIIGAHIRNTSAGLVTSTNVNGKFKIPVRAGDSLTITFVGYKTIKYYVKANTSDTLNFRLKQEVTQLSEVEVNVFPEYARFKDLILETQPKDTAFIVSGLSEIPLDAFPIPVNEQDITPPDYYAPSLAVGFDLGGLSKKGKEKKKFQKILAKQQMVRIAQRKFNREWVANATKLSGDELTDFIAFCDFSVEYLVDATVFDIHQRMMALLDEFQADKKKKGGRDYNTGA